MARRERVWACQLLQPREREVRGGDDDDDDDDGGGGGDLVMMMIW